METIHYTDPSLDGLLKNVVLLNLIGSDIRNIGNLNEDDIQFLSDIGLVCFDDNKNIKEMPKEEQLYEKADKILDAFLEKTLEKTTNVESGEIDKKYMLPYNMLSELVFNYGAEHIREFNLWDSKADSRDEHENDLKQRIIRQVKLSISQYTAIYLVSKEANDISNRAKMTAEKANNIADDAKKIANKAEKVKDKIYTDFITILGIFTAITFATFGGLQLIGNVFGNIKKFDLYSIGLDMMLGSILMFGIYIILMALIIGISKLKNKDDEYKINKKIASWILKAFLFIFSVGVILIIIHHVRPLIIKKIGFFWCTISISMLGLLSLILAFVYINKDKETH